MKVYTQEEFDQLERDEYGWKICPSGDYSGIRNFPGWCSFGERCRFGELCRFDERCRFGERCRFSELCRFDEWCSFGKQCSFENGRVKNGRYFACDRIGSEDRKTYFFADGKNKMYVRAGCFFWTLDEFVAQVKETHSGTKYERQYLSAVDLAKIVLLGE